MKKKLPIVIIDTNLWISFLISKEFSWLDNLIKSDKIKIVYSEELFLEIFEVLSRPKFKSYFNSEKIAAFSKLVIHYLKLIEVNSSIDLCRDEKDNFLLALAKDANADYIITGDKDLIILNPFEKTKILSFADFKTQFK